MNKLSIGILLLVLGLIVPTISIVKKVQFNQDCAGYLKQAADANTVELALERVNMALDYIEANNLTSGYTSVLWKTEDENIEFWYRNIKACQGELQNGLDGSQLEKANVLMKVRESLTDNGGDGGTVLTIPDGLSRYPYNALFGILNWISILGLILSIGLIVWYCGEKYGWD